MTALVLSACERLIPTPKLGPHMNEEPVTVPFPPPPAKVEVIPSPPPELKEPVWIDGEWQWKGSRWVWHAGQWELPVAGSYYAPPTTLRLTDGTLLYYPGTWKDRAKKP